MRQPIFVRTLTEEERKLIEAGLRSSDAFVLRRSQILLSSARRERVPSIARALSCDEQTMRNRPAREKENIVLSRMAVEHKRQTSDACLHARLDIPDSTAEPYGHSM